MPKVAMSMPTGPGDSRMVGEVRRVAIVAGGARGIGRRICLALAHDGFAVTLLDILAAELECTASEPRNLGAATMPMQRDAADYQDAHDRVGDRRALGPGRRAGEQRRRAAGQADPRHHGGRLGPRDGGEPEGCVNWSHAVAPQVLAQRSGRIINISSAAANHWPSLAGVSRFAYAAAKAGVLGRTRSLAVELARHVLVNAICPGPIETERTRATFAPNREQLARSVLVDRIGTPEDVAVVASFLATAEPLFMTGEVIDVDGGAFSN